MSTIPTYEQVVTETTGHREAVKIVYDPSVTSYEKLVDTFFHLIDPIETRGQFCDFGESYTTAIYAGNDTELKEAEAGRKPPPRRSASPSPLWWRSRPTFWPAEAYHQDFWKGTELLQNGLTRAEHYARYRAGCGKNAQVEAIWGKEAFRGLDGHA
jgi:peptide-methionine (S)-S-oxide reductase